MQYVLLLHSSETRWPELSPAEQAQSMAVYGAFTEALQKTKALRALGRLRPSSASTTVRVENGKTHVLDGPYVDSKEQLGGFYVIEAADLDEALAWAARCPAAQHGVIEVRPIWAHDE